MVFFRIEGGIGDGEDGFAFLQKFRDELLEFADGLGIFFGEVVLFADILAEIVEVIVMGLIFALEEFADELPVVVVDRDGGRKPVGDGWVVGKVSEDGTAFL